MSGNSWIERLQIKLLTTVTLGMVQSVSVASGVVGMLDAIAHFSPSSDLSLTVPVQLHQNQSSHSTKKSSHQPVALVSLESPSQHMPAGLFARWSQGAVRIIPLVEGAACAGRALSSNI